MKKILVAVIFLCFISIAVFAQPPGTRPPIEPPLIPIDAGAGYLIAAGLIIGIRKLLKSGRGKK